MNSQTASDVTEILARWKEGDTGAADDLFPLVYRELKSVASGYLARERRDHTLQTTALVHESYLRLSRVADLDARDRRHFYAVAARTMRRILIDHAREQLAAKRIAPGERVRLNQDFLGRAEEPSFLVAVHDALKALEQRHPRIARLVELRFFVGLSEAEAAALLGQSRATATRDWRFARLWLHDHLQTSES
ncbi:MAG: ECF-type sigma factor [Acidobacteriota bacterium]